MPTAEQRIVAPGGGSAERSQYDMVYWPKMRLAAGSCSRGQTPECRASAAIADRDFVTPDDVKALCEPVIGHRLVLRPEYELEGVTISEVVGKTLEQVSVPR